MPRRDGNERQPRPRESPSSVSTEIASASQPPSAMAHGEVRSWGEARRVRIPHMITGYGDGVKNRIPFLSLTPDLVYPGERLSVTLALYVHTTNCPRSHEHVHRCSISHGESWPQAWRNCREGQRRQCRNGLRRRPGKGARNRIRRVISPRLHNSTGRAWAARLAVCMSGMYSTRCRPKPTVKDGEPMGNKGKRVGDGPTGLACPTGDSFSRIRPPRFKQLNKGKEAT